MSKKKVGIGAFIKFYMENGKAFKAYPLRDQLRASLTMINLKISELDPSSEIYMRRVKEFNDLAVYHYAGKWYATEAIKTKNKKTWQKAFYHFKTGLVYSRQLKQLLDARDEKALQYKGLEVKEKNEIKFMEDVPLVPEITPIVILSGASEDMGYQYAEQLVVIYGEWILKRFCTRTFTKDESEEILRWESEHLKHTPELIEFAKGWFKYVKTAGIDMTYEQIIDLWVGHKPPTQSYLNAEAGIPDLPPLACTALAAWKSATEDGKLVVGATGDHDMSYQLTIVMYPDDGNPLVFTTFEATGTLPTVGPNWFFGHPGMNQKGLAYVHHGGGPKLLEPIESWGYGIRRGASVLHNLRYFDSARAVLEQEKQWPIGDIGYGDQATVGGFYADSDYGYVIESRQDPQCIREAGLLEEKDYLFSNNSVMHPDAIESEWMSKIKELCTWDTLGGWRPKQATGMTKSLGMIFKWFTGRLKTDELMSRGMMFAYWNSYNRNIFLNKMARAFHGQITPEVMKNIYRTTGTMPEGDFHEAKKAYIESGTWGKISAAHASNALVVIMKPEEGLYSLCTGPAIRGAKPISPDLAISIYNERNAFWDIRLLDTPEALLNAAQVLAEELFETAKKLYVDNESRNQQKVIFNELSELYTKKRAFKCENLMDINKSIRLYTRIQVLSRQFINYYKKPEYYEY